MEFKNTQLFQEDLPVIRALSLEGLEKDYIKVLFFGRLIAGIVILSIYVAIIFVFKGQVELIYLLPGLMLVVLLIIMLLALTKQVFKVKEYGVRQKDIIYKTGLITRKTTIIPYNRVQHVEIKNGPIDRMFKLSQLKIFTAGGSQSDLTIPGLRPDHAQRIKELIINKTAMDEEE